MWEGGRKGEKGKGCGQRLGCRHTPLGGARTAGRGSGRMPVRRCRCRSHPHTDDSEREEGGGGGGGQGAREGDSQTRTLSQCRVCVRKAAGERAVQSFSEAARASVCASGRLEAVR